MMKSKKYMLVVLSILMILFVFVSSAGAADANTTDVLSVDESSNMVNNEMDVLSIDESVNFENNETNILSADNNVNNDEILGNDLEPGDLDIKFSTIPTNITVNPKSLDLTLNENGTINATLDPSEAGNLEVDYNETIIKVEQNEVTREWIVNALAEGNAIITFSFAGSEGYAPAENKTVTVTVNAKPSPSINVVAENLTKYYGGSEQFSVNVTDEEGKGIPDKNVSILINGVNNKRTTDGNGIARLNINLPSGEYVANVTVDDITVNATVTVLPTVSGSDVRKVYGQKASYNATFLDEEGEYLPNGTEVSFNINGDIQKETISDDNGLASLNINLPVGDYIVTATNPVTGEKASNTIVVTQAESDIIVNGKNISVSDVNAVIADIVLPGDATGNVSVTIGDNTTVYDVQTSNHTSRGGKLIMFISNNGLNVGEYNISAVYEGDTNYKASNASDQFVVSDKKYLNIEANAEPITVGENATVVVTGFPLTSYGAPSGIVTVTVGDKIFSGTIEPEPYMSGGNIARIIVPGLNETTIADVNYLGDDKYNPANTTVEIVVNSPGKMNLTISASAEPITVGENATVVVTGFPLTSYGAPSGIVTVTVGDKIFSGTIEPEPYMSGGNIARIIVPGLNETTIADVNYLGDDKYNPANTTVEIVVNSPGKMNLTISASAEPITVGENATVVVTGFPLTSYGAPSGIVTVTVGDKIFSGTIEPEPYMSGGNIARIIVPGLNETTIADVNYLGDDKYNPANTTVEIVVNSPGKMNLTISASAEPITVGENATVVVTGFPLTSYGAPSGIVTVTVGDKIFSGTIEPEPYMSGGNIARIIVPGLNETTIADVNYLGDDKYNPANTTVIILVNSKDKENLTISASAEPIFVGNNATVVVTGFPLTSYGAPGGIVTVTVGDRIFSGTIEPYMAGGNIARIIVPGLTESAVAVVNYLGDDKYNPANTTVEIIVNSNNIIIDAPDVVKYYGGPERFVVYVCDNHFISLVNKSVTIVINGVTYNKTTDELGAASIAIGLPSGVYNVTSSVDNQTVNSVVTVLSTVNGTDVVKMFRNGTQYYATFLDAEGKFLADGTVVKFNINGVVYERKVSGDKGLAKLNINLPAGEYVITAINPVTGENAANNITVLSTVVENRDITKYYRNATQYTVKVLGADGNPVGEGKLVSFNINGVVYQRQTNASSIAQLNINLPPGNYVITASYEGCSVSNDITVLPVLSASDLRMKYMDGSKFKATLLDGQGKPYAEQKIQFNVNGVLYSRTTDSNGQAELNIRLPSGEYIITSSYNGANIANKITITP